MEIFKEDLIMGRRKVPQRNFLCPHRPNPTYLANEAPKKNARKVS